MDSVLLGLGLGQQGSIAQPCDRSGEGKQSGIINRSNFRSLRRWFFEASGSGNVAASASPSTRLARSRSILGRRAGDGLEVRRKGRVGSELYLVGLQVGGEHSLEVRLEVATGAMQWQRTSASAGRGGVGAAGNGVLESGLLAQIDELALLLLAEPEGRHV